MVFTGSESAVAGPSSLVDVALMQRQHCNANRPSSSSSSMPPRRQSDSTLTGRERIDLDEDGRAKLRRWAAEALEAPPPLMVPCEPTKPARPLQSATSLGRSSRPRSRSPVGSTSVVDPETLSLRRKSLFVEQTLSPGALSSLPDERPRSSVTTPTATSFPSAATMMPSSSSPALGLAQRRLQSGRLDENLVQRIATPAPDVQVARGPASALSSETTPRPRPGKAANLHSLPRLKTVKMQEPGTPRGHSAIASTYDSPRSTTSTCESDEDRAIVMTPLDDALPSARYESPLASAGNGTPPLNTLTDAPADRLGSSLGLETLGRSHESPISTYIASGRRGSASLDHSPSPLRPLTACEDNHASVPPLSRSTLMDLGSVKGLTPPYLVESATPGQGHNAVSSAAESSNVVSAGLEMGLGVSMATAALAANLPAHASGLGNFADPRHARLPMSRGFVDPLPQSEGLRTTDSEVSGLREMVHHDEASYYASADTADLSRRKTTGWDAGKIRRDLSKRHRAETHDEVVSQNAALIRQATQHAAPLSRDVATAKEQQQQQLNYVSPVRPMVSLLPGDLSDPSRPSGSSTVSSWDSRSTHARASRTGSAQLDTPSLSGRAMLSPDVNPLTDMRGGILGGGGGGAEMNEDVRVTKAREAMLRDAAYGAQASGGNNGGLMGSNVGGHFGPGVRAKVIEVLDPLIASVPMTGEDGETFNLVEYGCLNSRSIPVMQLIISKFAQRAADARRTSGMDLATVGEDSDLRHGRSGTLQPRGHSHRHIEPEHSRASFTVLHEDAGTLDFRPVIQSLDSRSDSYLDSQWQASHKPSLQDCVFSSFVGRPFASRIAPPKTMHFGISLMDMHWTHTPSNNVMPMATTSHAELVTFLRARSHEFKTGGVLVVAFLARSEDAASLTRKKSLTSAVSGPGGAAGSKAPSDIWTKLTNTLAPCIQRLVSCGMLKSDVARFLLDLPLHPRTPRQTCNALNSLRNLWGVEWSCGLGLEASNPSSSSNPNLPPSEASPLRIAHPAWKAFQAGTLSKVALTEHMLMLFKNLYEAHFRTVLRERGKLSKGAAEFVLDSLWDILSSKIDDQHPHSTMEEVEIEVSIVALKRL
ncbi:hypothetical protein BDZ90DRAFT_257387 [Jaminaea rosea]|uniref:Uncharacterized protein n=1 Tax=Jaminaea rosea TaxID=1569628 RepID=A0A316UYL0_9BASI|nr:hypothetical protein BDZ90DRAFT_257387 [Jaminaea rosea]PWN30302.1 hypothetical protein BDZ90DRAFT_257387 [Jaminaea rosea]